MYTLCTHHVDLGHGVDEDDGEDGDGEAEEEAAGQVPDDAPQPDRQQQHQDDGDPDEGGEEQQEEDGGAGQHQRLRQPITGQYCGGWTNQSSVFTCSPPSSSVTSSEQDSEAGNPMSGSSWY